MIPEARKTASNRTFRAAFFASFCALLFFIYLHLVLEYDSSLVGRRLPSDGNFVNSSESVSAKVTPFEQSSCAPCSAEDFDETSLVLSPLKAIQNFAKANLEKSDKISYHNYHVVYGPALAPFMRLPVRLLEIGVDDGKSLKLWERLFPKIVFFAGIGYGVGAEVKDTFKRHLNEKHVLYTGSQTDSEFLGKVLEDLDGEKFDIIIDDGSHVPWHQVFTLEYMFDSFLQEGGVYVIEDIETSYWDSPGANLYGYSVTNAGIGKHGSFVEKMKSIADVVNRGMLLDSKFSVLHNAVDHLISHITFSQNCVILHKKNTTLWENADKNVYNYQFPNFMEPTREDYRQYKATTDWEVDGMERTF